MVEENCSLLDKCLVVKETKKHKRFTRVVNCNNCEKKFHAYCCGWETMSENEVNDAESTFVCIKCNRFISAVADKIYEKVDGILNAMKNEIAQLRQANVDLKATFEQVKNGTVDEATNIETVEDEELDLHKSDSPNHLTSEKKQSTTEQYDNKILYLCSVESQLSVEDIRLILNDANIALDDLYFSQPDKDFKAKKYIEINSLNAVKLFKFKFSFEKSNLNGTWFLRTTPPKSKVQTSNASNAQGFIKNSYSSNKNSRPFHNKTAVGTSARYNHMPLRFHSNNSNNKNINNSNNNNYYNNSRKNLSFQQQKTHSNALSNRINNSTQQYHHPFANYNANYFHQASPHTADNLHMPSYANAVTQNFTQKSNAIVPFLENLVQTLKET